MNKEILAFDYFSFFFINEVLLMHLLKPVYTEYADCAVTAAIPVNFGTGHGKS